MRCTDHCPDVGGNLLVPVMAVVTVVVAVAVNAVIDDVLVAVFWSLLAVFVASVAYTVRVFRREFARVPVRPAAALNVAATQVHQVTSVRPRAAITERRVHAITDLPGAQQGAPARLKGER